MLFMSKELFEKIDRLTEGKVSPDEKKLDKFLKGKLDDIEKAIDDLFYDTQSEVSTDLDIDDDLAWEVGDKLKKLFAKKWK